VRSRGRAEFSMHETILCSTIFGSSSNEKNKWGLFSLAKGWSSPSIFLLHASSRIFSLRAIKHRLCTRVKHIFHAWFLLLLVSLAIQHNHAWCKRFLEASHLIISSCVERKSTFVWKACDYAHSDARFDNTTSVYKRSPHALLNANENITQ
jgi:hypothetical protein